MRAGWMRAGWVKAGWVALVATIDGGGVVVVHVGGRGKGEG